MHACPDKDGGCSPPDFVDVRSTVYNITTKALKRDVIILKI
jgi:hypothetical protein